MSIINQALQKAQRAQLVQRQHDMPYLLAGQQRRLVQRRRLLLPLGLGVLLGLGGIGYRWLTPPPPRPAMSAAAPHATPMALAGPALPEAPEPTSGVSEAPVIRTGVAPLPGREDAPGRRVPEPPQVVVLAVEAPSGPPPVPRVMPMPLLRPATAPVPPLPEPASGSDAVSVDSERSQALFQRALEAQESGDLKRAGTLLEQAVKLDPSAKGAYNSLGNVYFQQKRFQQAVNMYHKALAIDPDYAKARNNLGSTYMQMAMYDKAIEELQRAVRADGEMALAYYNLACVYARRGDSTTTAQYLQQAIALEPQARTWARTDADFASVRSALEARQLLEP